MRRSDPVWSSQVWIGGGVDLVVSAAACGVFFVVGEEGDVLEERDERVDSRHFGVVV